MVSTLRRSRTSSVLRSIVLTCAAASAASSQIDAPVDIVFDRAIYVAGDVIEISLRGAAGDVPIVFVSMTPGPAFAGKLGTLDVSLGPATFVLVLPPLESSADGSDESRYTLPTTCDDPNLGLSLFTQLVTLDGKTRQVSGTSPLRTLDVMQGDCGDCPHPAISDPSVHAGDVDSTLWLPGIGDDFVMRGGLFTEHADGTAVLVGLAVRASNPNAGFVVNLAFSDAVMPADPAFPPAGSPKLELFAPAYADNGGPVDPRTWHYYQTTSGTLLGVDDYAGALLDVARAGPSFQVGFGANGKNTRFGASGWLDVTTLAQPTNGGPFPANFLGDVNTDLGGDCVLCPLPAAELGAAMLLPGLALGGQYRFESGSVFVENECGFATLTGTIAGVADPTYRWQVDIVLGGKVAPGSPTYPPVDSPKKELPGWTYVEGGGLIDTSAWWYYETLTGTLVGLDALAGGEVSIQRAGPAFQIGFGANGKDYDFGGSGWLDVELLAQPTTGIVLPEDPPGGDITLDLELCPDDV